jgi:hypothetical protein
VIPPLHESILRLQRSAGNRAVCQVIAAGGHPGRRPVTLCRDSAKQPTPQIHVHQGSTYSAAQFVDALRKNKHAPAWLTKALSSTGKAIALSGTMAPQKGRTWLFDDSFQEALKNGTWELTTAKSTIEVKESGGKLTWNQIVKPDLAPGEGYLGTWLKTGDVDVETLTPTNYTSSDKEIIYGWTTPNEQTKKTHDKHGFVLIVTEIEVTAPTGKKKKFKPGPDNIAEAFIHEIGVHAGRISQGKPDVHDDTSRAIKDVVEQIGEFFRASSSGSGLEVSRLTKEIFKFVGEPL